MLKKDNYNPNTKYYMLSVIDNEEVRWIRNTFMNEYEIKDWIDHASQYDGRYSKLEIFDEKTLDLLTLCPTNETGVKTEITLRHALFGGRYQKFADKIRMGAATETEQK